MTRNGPSAQPAPRIAGETWRFAALLFFFWSSVVTLEGFLVPYLTSIGFGSGAAGLVMSSVFLAGIVCAPLWGMVCDATDRHRTVVVTALAVAIVIVLLIPVAAPSFALVFLLGVLYSATGNSMPGVLDSWIMRRRLEEPRIEYGIARGFGSAGFAVGGVVLGRLSDVYGPQVLFPAYAVVIGMALLMIVRLPGGSRSGSWRARERSRSDRSTSDESRPAESMTADSTPGEATTDAGAEPRPSEQAASGYGEAVLPEADRPVVATAMRYSGEAARAVISSTPYLVFLVVSLVIIIQLRAAITFMPLLIYEVGGSNIHVGLSQTVAASSEIPFMFATALLLRYFRPRALLLFGMAGLVVRTGIMGWMMTPGAIVAVQALHGLSFGVFLPVSIHYIDRVAPRQYATFFQTLAPSIYFGLGSVIGSSLGGVFVEAFGLRPMYRLLGLPALAATLAFACFMLYEHRRGRRTVAGGRRPRYH